MSAAEKTDMGDKTFGLWCQFPDNANVGWGARLIIHDRFNNERVQRRRKNKETGQWRKIWVTQEVRWVHADLVWDRQSSYGTKEDRQALCQKLNKGGEKSPIKKALKEIERLVKKYEMYHSASRTFLLYDKNGLKIWGDTNASGGYCHIIAYEEPPKPEPVSEPSIWDNIDED